MLDNKRMQLADPTCHAPWLQSHRNGPIWIPNALRLRRMLIHARVAPGGPQLMHNVMWTQS